MKVKRSIVVNIAIALVVSTSVVALSDTAFLEGLRLESLNLLFRLRGPLRSHPDIIIIEIDDDNIEQIGRWPWKREWYAAMVRALQKLGAKAVYFDILFPEAASEEEDSLFSQAIKEAKNVYLPFAFQERAKSIERALLPIERFSSYTKGIGSINIYPDSDGVLRRIPLFFIDRDTVHYHITLRIALDSLGAKLEQISDKHLLLSHAEGTIEIPLVDEGMMLINWQDTWKETFAHYSFIEVLNAYQDIVEKREPDIDVACFKEGICLIGVTAMGLYDINSVPLEPEYPAIGVVATAIGNILDRQFIRESSQWINFGLIYGLALLLSLLVTGERVGREIIAAVLTAAAFITTDFILFKRSVWVDPTLPLISLFGSYLCITTYNFIRVAAEKKNFFKLAVTDELTRLYNIRYFKVILRTECIMAKSDASKQFCIIMGDIDHFKNFNDTYGHHVGDLVLREVAHVLRTTVRTSDVVARYGGEEMVILLRGVSLENGQPVAENVRKRVEDHQISDEKNTYKVTISLGIASFRPDDNEDTVLKRADEGLYRAKNLGRNRVETMEKTDV